MDFDLDEEQEQVRQLAARIFGDLADHHSQRKLETAVSETHPARSASTANCGRRSPVPGCSVSALPETYGGAGLGLLAACVVVEEAGRLRPPSLSLPPRCGGAPGGEIRLGTSCAGDGSGRRR